MEDYRTKVYKKDEDGYEIIPLAEGRAMRAQVMKLFGSVRYAKECRKANAEAARMGRRQPSAEVICLHMLREIEPPKPVMEIQHLTMGAPNMARLNDLLTTALNRMRNDHPELRVVSPVQYVKSINGYTGTVMYEHYVVHKD